MTTTLKMKKNCLFILLIIGCILIPTTALSEDKGRTDLPWEKAYLNVGWFFADLNSSFRFGAKGAGLGISLDVEDLLGLDEKNSSFRIDGGWRFSKNKRHKLELGWFAFDREATGTISQEIEVPPDLGGGTIGPGDVKSKFNFDILRVKYEYSLILDDRMDFNLGIGLFIMPMEFGITAIVNGVEVQELEEDITAPLPVISVGLDLAVTPKWFIRQDFEFFYLEIDNFEGSIFSATLAVEYLPWKNFGFGLGLDGKSVQIEANNSDYPGMDWKGNVEFSYFGALLYAKVFF